MPAVHQFEPRPGQMKRRERWILDPDGKCSLCWERWVLDDQGLSRFCAWGSSARLFLFPLVQLNVTMLICQNQQRAVSPQTLTYHTEAGWQDLITFGEVWICSSFQCWRGERKPCSKDWVLMGRRKAGQPGNLGGGRQLISGQHSSFCPF